jgi:hypothetical protein
VVGITVGPARHLSRSGEAGGMSCSIGITDNDWFAFLSQQPGIDEVNLLSIKKQGLIFKEYLQDEPYTSPDRKTLSRLWQVSFSLFSKCNILL